MSWPRPQYRNTLDFSRGNNPDIIDTIHRRVPEAKKSIAPLAATFRGATTTDTARNIWNFLKTNVRYKKDPAGYQFIKLPARLLADGYGDCKSYSLFTAGVLENLGIPYRFRYTSYDGSSIPQHVYIVTESGDIIDAVWHQFGAEKPFTFKKDFPMKIYTLSGIGCPGVCAGDLSGTGDSVMIGSYLVRSPLMKTARKRSLPQAQIRQLKTTAVKKNECMLGGYDDEAIGNIFKKAASKVKQAAGSVKKAASKVQDKVKSTGVVKKAAQVQSKAKDTGVIKTLSKLQSQVKEGGVKSVALAGPRRAYRTLVAVNFRGWASKLASNPSKAREIWEKAGGIWSELEKSIGIGKGKKAVFGRSADKIRTVDGIGDATLTTVGALLALAAPLIALFRNLVPDSGSDAPASDEGGTAPPASEGGSGDWAGDALDAAAEVIKKAVDIFTPSSSSQPSSNAGSFIPGGSSPGAPATSAQESGSTGMGTLLPIAIGLGALYMITKK